MATTNTLYKADSLFAYTLESEMNVGIVTFHNAHNYGALLQSVALKYAINKLGCECRIINHNNIAIDDAYKVRLHSIVSGIRRKPWLISLVFNRLVLFIGRLIRSKKFNRFIGKLYQPVDIDIFKPDKLVFGSDQIWNEIITGHDTYYYGNVPDSEAKKIAYAASLGWGKESFLSNNKHLLADFQAIGVREKSLQQSLSEIGLQSELNADPTLLLTKEDWNKLFDFDEEETGNYIFVYAIRNRAKVLEAARRIAKANGCKVVELNSHESFSFQSVFSSIGYSTPRDFVRLLKNARAVVTDSFHGTVFSIIYNKPFISAKLGNKGDDRIHSLVTTLGIESHFVDLDTIENSLPQSLDNAVSDRLAQFKSSSIEYLKRNLNN